MATVYVRPFSVKEIVEMAGGLKKVSEELGVNQSAVSHWRERGIPQKNWRQIMSAAPEVTADDLFLAYEAARVEHGK